MMVSVGIDVSKDKHDCFIVNSEGEILADVFTIPNNMDGFALSVTTNPGLRQHAEQNKSSGLRRPDITATICSGFFLQRSTHLCLESLAYKHLPKESQSAKD